MSAEKIANNEKSNSAKIAEVVAVDLVSALHQKDGNFPAREQLVANFVKANLEKIPNMNIADVASGCGVSTPTVIRFCRSLGCDGFREFKIRFAQNLAVSLQYLSNDSNAVPLNGDTALDQVLGGLYACANVMRKQIDIDMLEKAKLAIAHSGQILTAGIGGGSSMIAMETANRFFRLGVPTHFVSDSYTLQMRAATLTKSDALFLISTSGEADEIVSAAYIAGGYGASVICITRPNTRLAAAATIPILVDLPEDPHVHKPTASRYAHLALVDAIAMSVAQYASETTNENLRRIRASLTAFHGRTGPQPLGD